MSLAFSKLVFREDILIQRHFQRFLLKSFLKFFHHEDIISKFYCKDILKAFFMKTFSNFSGKFGKTIFKAKTFSKNFNILLKIEQKLNKQQDK